MTLTIASLGMVVYIYGGWNGQRAGISFLVLLVTLKFLESEALRDYFVVCLLLYFLGASSFLFDSSITIILLVIAYTIAITNILLQLSNPTDVPSKKNISLATGMIVRALPLAIILFFFFPRIQADFGLFDSLDSNTTASELSDSLVAGELALSAFNEKLAFRAEFSSDEKPQYQILHEESTDRYRPYLDYVVKPSNGKLYSDFSVYTRKPELRAFAYTGSSSGDSFREFSKPSNIEALLQLKTVPNAKMQLQFAQWQEGAKDEFEVIQRILNHFKNENFEYALEPKPLDEFQPFNDFMLNSRSGYCEHYASAFTIVMRSMGIPSRVVAGYQGGTEVNDGQYLEIRYSNAHAWSEVWIGDRWYRVDPTAAINPDRINLGMSSFMELWNSGAYGSNDSGQALESLLNPTGISKIFMQLGDNWKSLGYQWNKWVVNYDFDSQRQLLRSLGLKNKNSVTTLVSLMILGALILMAAYFWQLVPRRIKRQAIQTDYLKFVSKFKRHKLFKAESETPIEFSQKAINLFPEKSEDITEITKLYNQLRYSIKLDNFDDDVVKLKTLIKQLKLEKSSK